MGSYTIILLATLNKTHKKLWTKNEHSERGQGRLQSCITSKQAIQGRLNYDLLTSFFLFDQKITVMFAWIVCFLVDGSTNRHVNSSTDAEIICKRGCVLGNVASRLRISSLSTFKQAIFHKFFVLFAKLPLKMTLQIRAPTNVLGIRFPIFFLIFLNPSDFREKMYVKSEREPELEQTRAASFLTQT